VRLHAFGKARNLMLIAEMRELDVRVSFALFPILIRLFIPLWRKARPLDQHARFLLSNSVRSQVAA
jgi:hypothetical protein